MMNSRDRIIEAAISMFARKGRHGAHMQEIALSAHVNKALIYYFYRSKDELYYEVIKCVFERLIESFIAQAGSMIGGAGHNTAFFTGDNISQYSFYKDKEKYMKILVDALISVSDETAQAIRYIDEKYRDWGIPLLHGKTAESFRFNEYYQRTSTDRGALGVFLILVVNFMPGYLQELWSAELS